MLVNARSIDTYRLQAISYDGGESFTLAEDVPELRQPWSGHLAAYFSKCDIAQGRLRGVHHPALVGPALCVESIHTLERHSHKHDAAHFIR